MPFRRPIHPSENVHERIPIKSRMNVRTMRETEQIHVHVPPINTGKSIDPIQTNPVRARAFIPTIIAILWLIKRVQLWLAPNLYNHDMEILGRRNRRWNRSR